MALVKPGPPAAVVEALREGLEDEEIKLVPPLEQFWFPIYVLAAPSLNAANLPMEARASGWQSLIADSRQTLVAAEVSVPAGARPVMRSVSQEPEVADYVRWARQLGPIAEQHTLMDDYETRLLRIPSLSTEVFWLKAPAGKSDLVVPFHTLIRELRTMQVQIGPEFLKTLSPLVSELLGPANPDQQSPSSK
jgi:hypothetical protein